MVPIECNEVIRAGFSHSQLLVQATWAHPMEAAWGWSWTLAPSNKFLTKGQAHPESFYLAPSLGATDDSWMCRKSSLSRIKRRNRCNSFSLPFWAYCLAVCQFSFGLPSEAGGQYLPLFPPSLKQLSHLLYIATCACASMRQDLKSVPASLL